MIPYAKPALIAALVAAVASGGWLARGWFEDSKTLAVVEAQHALAAEIRQGQAEVSKQVADHLSQMQGTERVIDRGIIREIRNPIYQRVCLSDRAISLLNAAAAGADPGEPDGEVPPDAAGTD